MRTFTGIVFIMIIGSIFVLLLSVSTTEFSAVTSIDQILDEKIQIDEQHVLPITSYMYDREGKRISTLHHNQQRQYISFDELPQIVKDLYVLTEDKHFYEHKGFDLTGIARALFVNLEEQSTEQGGSTISQQLARNLYLTHEKTYERKLKEVLISYQLERSLPKEKILELYVNAIYFQNGVYGIETASQFYFQRPLSALSLPEIVFISVIPNNPTLYDPLTNFPSTIERQKRILKLLFDNGFISETEWKQAEAFPITLSIKKKEVEPFPDYSTYVLHEFEDLVATSEGFSEKLKDASDVEKEQIQTQLSERVQEVLQSGIHIHTALSPSLQQTAKESLTKHIRDNTIEGAAVVIDHHNQEIVSIVGGKHYQKQEFHRAYQAYRQPGSTIKPLLVYGPYIEEKGATSSSIVNANRFCKQNYCPENYGNRQYGNVRLATAFKFSYNTPAVRLLNELGIEKGFSYLRNFGFQRVDSQDMVLSSAIGGFTYGMSPLELTNAYTTFANDGTYKPARAITKVVNENGELLYKWNEEATMVWSQKTNNEMRKLLHEVVTSGTAKKAHLQSRYIGGKTGTTNQFKDLWFIGLTEAHTVGVWVGRDQPSSIEAIDKQTPQLRIWKDIILETK